MMRHDAKGGSALAGVPWRIEHADAATRVERAAADARAFAKQEEALARSVADWRKDCRKGVHLPSLPGPLCDAGPTGLGRGAVVADQVDHHEFDAQGRVTASRPRVVRRAESDALARLPFASREAARRYAGLAEMARSIRAPADGPRGAVGDGGAAARCETSRRLWACEAVIGTAVVLSPRGVQAQADRGRRVLRVRDVVDAVALDGVGMSVVLGRWGWSRGPGNRHAAMEALAEALDRLAAHLGLATKQA